MKQILTSLIGLLLLVQPVYAQSLADLTELSTSKIAGQIFREINEIRESKSLTPLLWDSELAQIAEAHSRDMITRDYFAHVNPEGLDAQDRAQAAGIASPTQIGENLFDMHDILADDVVNTAVTGWVNSPKHYENILYPTYTHTGIGVAQSDDLRDVRITQVFYIKPAPAVSSLLGGSLTRTTTQSTTTTSSEPTRLATPVTNTAFVDVSTDNEFAEYVTELSGRGVIQGQETATGRRFYGTTHVTREQLVTMLVRALDYDLESSTKAPFTDIDRSSLKREIATAYVHEITTGYPDKTFRPNQPVTRAEAAALIARAFGLTSDDDLPFTDVPANSLREGIQALYGNGIVSGRTRTRFAPGDLVTRFEVAKMIQKALEASE